MVCLDKTHLHICSSGAPIVKENAFFVSMEMYVDQSVDLVVIVSDCICT